MRYTHPQIVLKNTYITFMQRLFNFVQLLIKHGELLFSISMLLFLHLKRKSCIMTKINRAYVLCIFLVDLCRVFNFLFDNDCLLLHIFDK